MSRIGDEREALATYLNTVDGVRAVATLPQTFTPPIVWVSANTPYRQRGQAVGSKKVNFAVVCLGGNSQNDAAEAATEDLAELVADAIDASTDFALDPVTEMDQPRLYPAAQQGQMMLGIAVNAWTLISRG